MAERYTYNDDVSPSDKPADVRYVSRDPQQVNVKTYPDDKSKQLKKCRLLVIILVILVIALIVIIAVVSWMLVAASAKDKPDDSDTGVPAVTETLPSGTFVSFDSDNPVGSGTGMLYGDPLTSPIGLIVMHEWWGMNIQIQNQGAMISRDGNFTVIVLDVYRGEVADDREEAGHLSGGLDWTGAMLDISGAARYLKKMGCRRVGATGYCMGGALCFASATNSTGISAIAPFYGIPNADRFDLTTIDIPIQGHFGREDTNVGFSSPADYRALKTKLDTAGVDLKLFEYDAGHAFTNPNGANYNKNATELALSRMYNFMHQNL